MSSREDRKRRIEKHFNTGLFLHVAYDVTTPTIYGSKIVS